MAPRTVIELKARLADQGGDPTNFCFGDCFERYDVHCLEPRATPAGTVWDTYYTEGRGQADLRTFADEATACAYFLSWAESRGLVRKATHDA
jgi:hypothetical protein